MNIDKYGQPIFSEEDICDLYLSDPDRKIKSIVVKTPILLTDIIDITKIPEFKVYKELSDTVVEFDKTMQDTWFVPESYKDFDIAKYVLDLCHTDEELQRVGHELLLFQERDMFPLLQYLKYLVDTMRNHNVLWGVGRGSSVASFVLFLIGIHRINSLYYDLSINEFLK